MLGVNGRRERWAAVPAECGGEAGRTNGEKPFRRQLGVMSVEGALPQAAWWAYGVSGAVISHEKPPGGFYISERAE